LAVLPALLTAFSVSAQQYNISTIAGGVPIPTPALATSSPLGYPGPIASDAAGNVYFISDDCVFKIDVSGNLTRIAGTSRLGFAGDGGSPLNAQFQSPAGIAIDSSNNIYVADSGNNRIRRISGGVITTIAGGATAGYGGDNMPAANALLNNPQGLAVDSASNLYIADTGNNVVRKISISTGYIIPVAGNGIPGNSGDTQLALAAQLNAPVGVAVDSVNNVYIADSGNHRVRFVNMLTGVITAFAGTGTAGYNGDLIGPLADRGIRLSSSQVYRLVTERPERLGLKILMALLDILDCDMTDLIEPVPAAVQDKKKARAAGGDAGVGDLRPKRARITGPGD